MPSRLWLIALLLVTESSHAGEIGKISGIVRNAHGEAVEGASVVVQSATAANDARRTRTSRDGSYTFDSLPPGDYSVFAEDAGSSRAQRSVHVEGTNVTADFVIAAQTVAPASPRLQASGVRGLIDPGGYSAPAQAAAAAGLVSGMSTMRPATSPSAADFHCATELELERAVGAETAQPEAMRRLAHFYLAHNRFEDARALLLKLAQRYQADPNTTAAEWFDAGYGLILAGAPSDASVLFRGAREKLPQSSEIWMGSGAADFLAGNSTLAVDALLQAVSLNPRDARSYSFLVSAFEASGARPDRVEAALRRFTEIAPGDAEAFSGYAAVLLRNVPASTARVEELLKRAVALKPSYAKAHVQLGALYNGRQDYPAAIREYEAAVALNPTLADAHYRLALAERRSGHEEQAAEHLNAFEKLRADQSANTTAAAGALLSASVKQDDSVACPANAEHDEHLRAGIAAATKGNLGTAMGEILLAVRANPQAAEAHYRLGLLLGQTHDFRRAEAEFRRASELRPDFAEAWYNLGLSLIGDPLTKLDWPGAIAAFRKALEIRPNYGEAGSHLGAGLLALNEVDAAVLVLQAAVRSNPALAEAHFQLATALERKNRTEEAKQEYRLANPARANNPAAATALAKLLLREGKMTEAQSEIEGALRVNPDYKDAHYLSAKVLQAQGKDREAEAELDQVRDLNERSSRAAQASRLTNEGLEAAARGQFDAALELEQQAVSLQPDFGVAHHNLGLILADRRDWAAAQRELVKAASLLPGRAEPWYDIGRILKQQGDREGALLAFSWAATLAPSDAKILAERDEMERALKTTGRLAAQPQLGALSDTASARMAFAQRLASAHDFVGATGELLRVLALEPANIQARCALAQAYLQTGQSARAVLEFQKVLLVDPENSAAKAALAAH